MAIHMYTHTHTLNSDISYSIRYDFLSRNPVGSKTKYLRIRIFWVLIREVRKGKTGDRKIGMS